jgi:hypothetical protein
MTDYIYGYADGIDEDVEELVIETDYDSGDISVLTDTEFNDDILEVDFTGIIVDRMPIKMAFAITDAICIISVKSPGFFHRMLLR